jgi:site-specific recombinase XerD
MRRIGAYFDYRLDELTEAQLLDYFTALLETHSWSSVKLDLYGLKFYYQHVLHQPWLHLDLIKAPKTQRLPNIVTVEEAQRLFMATRAVSYRVFFFTALQFRATLRRGFAPPGGRYRCAPSARAYS